tara:strand:+ start:2152 stop:2487 length:336 start_codon:yes stop_codon:yes gene_type:complete
MGDIIKKERNSEIPTSTVFGGVCAVPIACRSRDITIIILTKDVIIIRSDGSNVSTVIKIRIWSVRLYSVPSAVWLILMAGSPVWPIAADVIERLITKTRSPTTLETDGFIT